MPANPRAAGYAWALKQAPTTPLTTVLIEAAYCRWAHIGPDQFAAEIAFAPAPPALVAWRIGVADAAASEHAPRLLPGADGCLSIRQIATAQDVDRSYVTREVQDGSLPAHRVGSEWRITVTDYCAWRDVPGRGQYKQRRPPFLNRCIFCNCSPNQKHPRSAGVSVMPIAYVSRPRLISTIPYCRP